MQIIFAIFIIYLIHCLVELTSGSLVIIIKYCIYAGFLSYQYLFLRILFGYIILELKMEPWSQKIKEVGKNVRHLPPLCIKTMIKSITLGGSVYNPRLVFVQTAPFCSIVMFVFESNILKTRERFRYFLCSIKILFQYIP